LFDLLRVRSRQARTGLSMGGRQGLETFLCRRGDTPRNRPGNRSICVQAARCDQRSLGLPLRVTVTRSRSRSTSGAPSPNSQRPPAGSGRERSAALERCPRWLAQARKASSTSLNYFLNTVDLHPAHESEIAQHHFRGLTEMKVNVTNATQVLCYNSLFLKVSNVDHNELRANPGARARRIEASTDYERSVSRLLPMLRDARVARSSA
jgi:hypothetical protein